MLLAVPAVVGLGALAVLLLFLVFAAWFGLMSQGIGKSLQAAFDPTGKGVAVHSCGPDSRRNVEIGGTAHNATSTDAFYVIDIVVRNGSGTQIGEGTAAQKVRPNQTGRWTVHTKAKFASGVNCELSSVLRAP